MVKHTSIQVTFIKLALYVIRMSIFTMLCMPVLKANDTASLHKNSVALKNVATITVTERSTLKRKLVGTVFSPQTQVLSSQVSGRVISEHMSMGQSFQSGEVIVQLDNREAKARYQLADSELKSAMVRAQQRELDFRRLEKTFQKNLSSKADFDQANLLLKQAKIDVDIYEAKKQLAFLVVEKHSIRAPFDGRLLRNSPAVGKTLLPGEPVVEIINVNNLSVKVYFTHDELKAILNGKLSLVFQSTRARSLELLQYSTSTDSKSGMLEAEFQLTKNNNHDLNARSKENTLLNSFYSGQFLSLKLIEEVLAVPEPAIVEDTDGDFVYAIENSIVQKVLLSEVIAGQKVVVLGGQKLEIGDKVSALPVGDFK